MVEEEEEEADGWMGCVLKQMFTSTEKLAHIYTVSTRRDSSFLRCHHLLLGQL